MSVFRIGRLLLLFSPKITRYNGICKYTDDSAIIEPLPAGWKEITTTVASLRIDNIASAGLNISRRFAHNSLAQASYMLMLAMMVMAGTCGSCLWMDKY